MLLAKSSITSIRLKGSSSSSNIPASIFEKSRISFIMLRRELDSIRIVLKISFCLSSRSVALISSAMPMIPLRGVLISWLIFARKMLLARFAVSAANLACLSISACFRSVTSLTTPRNPVGFPSRSCINEADISRFLVSPSFLIIL